MFRHPFEFDLFKLAITRLMQFILGIILAFIVAFLAYRAGSLSRSGAFAATIVGTIIFGLGGLEWAVLLLTFFVTSSALSRMFKERKREASKKYAKGGQRDAGQVFGNGGIATLFAVTHVFFPDAPWPWLGFAAALAAVNADTWATELGVLSSDPPRMITNLRKVVDQGTSGGISWIGTLASFAGAGLIGLEAALLNPLGVNWIFFALVTFAGTLGAIFDSFLGATVQAIYHCPVCQKDTERYPEHSCGMETKQIRGWAWLNNDWVNFACGLFGVAAVMAMLILDKLN